MLRKFISLCLMLLMITPAMVCVMTLGQSGAEAAPPCHGKDMGAGHGQHKAQPPLLAGDCLKNDLGSVDTLSAPLPAGTFLFIAFTLPLMIFAIRPQPGALRLTTGPPPRRRPSFDRILITLRILQ